MPALEERYDLQELEEPIIAPEFKKPEKREPLGSVLRCCLQTVVITAALFFLITNFAAQGFAISGSCMEPNLHTGERVLGDKLSYRLTSPSRGDIVVFRYPVDPNRTYVKRVIGLPGETIEVRAGQVYINHKQLREPYVVRTPHGDYGPETIKPGKLFVMGDYRDQSNDSRVWGELPVENIKAKAWVRYWPPTRAQVMK
jgi:signal peptidase I